MNAVINTLPFAEPPEQPKRRGRQDRQHMDRMRAESVRKSKFRAARRRLEKLPPLRGGEVQELTFLLLVAGDAYRSKS